MELQGPDLRLGMQGQVVALLHTELQQLDLGVTISPPEIEGRTFGERTQAAVRAFQENAGLAPTGIVDAVTARRINEEVDARKPYVVEGRVVSRSRAGVGGLRVEIVDWNVADDVRLAIALTDDAGAYRTSFAIPDLGERGKETPDLQARAVAGGTFRGASDVRYNASNRETRNVLLTEKSDPALAPEHHTLLDSVLAFDVRSARDNLATNHAPTRARACRRHGALIADGGGDLVGRMSSLRCSRLWSL